MILVTGATGKVGKELVPLLLGQGEQVRILVRDERKAAHWGPEVERALGNLDHPETISPAMKGIERLFIVTPVTEQVRHLLDAARANGVRAIVKLSTIEAGRSLGPGKWHREQEQLIQASGASWTFLRPTMIMSNTIEWWGETIQRQASVFFPSGSGKVSPVDPRDVAAAACAALTQPEHDGQVYELTGPQVLTIREMVQTLAQVLGKPIRYVDVPAFLAAWWMRRSGLPSEVVKGLMETLGALRRHEYAYVTNCVEEITGHPPGSFDQWCYQNKRFFL